MKIKALKDVLRFNNWEDLPSGTRWMMPPSSEILCVWIRGEYIRVYGQIITMDYWSEEEVIEIIKDIKRDL